MASSLLNPRNQRLLLPEVDREPEHFQTRGKISCLWVACFETSVHADSFCRLVRGPWTLRHAQLVQRIHGAKLPSMREDGIQLGQPVYDRIKSPPLQALQAETKVSRPTWPKCNTGIAQRKAIGSTAMMATNPSPGICSTRPANTT